MTNISLKHKLVFGALLAVLVLPLHAGRASKQTWFTMSNTGVWDYGTHRVEELKLPRVVEGPFNVGDAVVVQTVATSCGDLSCGDRDAYILRNGSAVQISNVPKGVFDTRRIAENEGRVIWAVQVPDDSERYDIVELDLQSGVKTTLAARLFVGGAESMKVIVRGSEIFLNPIFNHDGHNGFKTATVLRYNPQSGNAEIVTKRYNAQHEELMDVDLPNDRLLTKMTFEGGEKELWLTKISSEYLSGEADRVVGSWTPAHEDILGAHFLPDNSVEYFRMYARTQSATNGAVQTFATASTKEYLSWTRPTENSLYIAGDNMVWVNTNNELAVSDPTSGITKLGSVDPYPVRMDAENLFYISSDGFGHVYDLNRGTDAIVPFRPTDRLGNAVVGVDESGTVHYYNSANDTDLLLGFGTMPTVSDERHIYWTGINGSVYEGTVSTNPKVSGTDRVRALRAAGSHTVFLTDGINRWTFPDDATYFTWFQSWDDVEVVPPSVIARYRDMGRAAYAPGTRVKSTDEARVYVVGSDRKLHWLMNEDLADAIYGPQWNKGILDVSFSDVSTYGIGSTIDEIVDFDRLST